MLGPSLPTIKACISLSPQPSVGDIPPAPRCGDDPPPTPAFCPISSCLQSHLMLFLGYRITFQTCWLISTVEDYHLKAWEVKSTY